MATGNDDSQSMNGILSNISRDVVDTSWDIPPLTFPKLQPTDSEEADGADETSLAEPRTIASSVPAQTEQPVLLASLPQYTGAANVIKRLLDIIGSLCALIISSPILLGVAIAIKLDDGGPVFFSQTRIGLHGKPFKMYKFRSMVTNAEELKKKLAEETGQEDRFIFKMKDDPRITKVGHFIRKTSLDEFPQLYNVLKGDMSLVGPRPALPEEVARYGSLYSARLLVKPGITGPWQVSGRSDLSQEQSEYLDVSYIENWSIAGDLAILAKTVMVIFTGRGSY